MTYSIAQLGKLSEEIILEAQKKPVRIAKNGKDCAAIISIPDLDLLEETKKSYKLRSAVQAGFSQIAEGNYSTKSMDEIFEEAKRKIKE